jgi:hypothetical protein
VLKALEIIKQIGKYITIGVCIVAIFYGVRNWVVFVPVQLSFICIGGLLIWLSGIIGVFVYKRLEKRAAKSPKRSGSFG